jgi:hypothetical protein
MDFTTYAVPQIAFSYWLCEFPPNQYTGIGVWLTNGVDTFLLEHLHNDSITGSWQNKFYASLPLLPEPRDQVRFMISATDTTTEQNGYILKAHFDEFQLLEGSVSSHDPQATVQKLTFYPNPVTGSALYVKTEDKLTEGLVSLTMHDIHGRFISSHILRPGSLTIDLPPDLGSGIYFLKWHTGKGSVGVEKIIVQQ